MQTVIVIAIVVAAALFIVRKAYVSFARSRQQSGCASCDMPTHSTDDWAR